MTQQDTGAAQVAITTEEAEYQVVITAEEAKYQVEPTKLTGESWGYGGLEYKTSTQETITAKLGWTLRGIAPEVDRTELAVAIQRASSECAKNLAKQFADVTYDINHTVDAICLLSGGYTLIYHYIIVRAGKSGIVNHEYINEAESLVKESFTTAVQELITNQLTQVSDDSLWPYSV